ncbi:MAG: hypothetical protein J2P18_02735 [Nocardia sp.]|nr:hypothetical protein [Nocardia sp.]
MSWEDHHARTAILHEVLARAAVDPATPGLFYDLPDCDRLFGGPAGVLAALRYRWDNHLRAKLEQTHERGLPSALAYREMMAEQPVLFEVLHAHLGRDWHEPDSGQSRAA